MFENLIEGEEYIFHFRNNFKYKGKVVYLHGSTCCIDIGAGKGLDFVESEVAFIEPVIDLEKDVIMPSSSLEDTSVGDVLELDVLLRKSFNSYVSSSSVVDNYLKNKYCSIRTYSRDSADGYIASVDNNNLYLSLLDGDKADVEWKQINSLTLFSDNNKSNQLLNVDLYNFKIYVSHAFYFDVFCHHVFEAHTKSKSSLNIEVDDEFVNIKLTGYDLLLETFKSYINEI